MAKVLNIKDYGYEVPEGAVYVGRAMPRYNLPASKWGNPMSIREIRELFPSLNLEEARQEAVDWYRRCLAVNPGLLRALPELRGKDLVCWCSPLPCHGDVLLKLANE